MWSAWSRAAAAWLVAGAVWLGSPPCHAYELEGVVGEPCHESLSERALDEVRGLVDNAPEIDPTGDDQALIDDVPFDVARNDLARVTLLLGVRNNDLHGNGSRDLSALPNVHGDPKRQDEHCLRAPHHDEPDGSAEALDDCRAFIRARFDRALTGLNDAGVPDSSVRSEVEVTLAIRGQIEVSVPTFWFELGRALHALQDSFTHSYRVANGRRVTAVLNYVDVVEEDYDEARDGPAHSRELDACGDLDELRRERRALAQEASTALLLAALAPDGAEDKGAALTELLDAYLTFEPGCNAGNGWCDAPEQRYADTGCSCSAAGVGRGAVWLGWLALLAALGWRRRGTAAACLALPLIGSASTARAQEELPWQPTLGIAAHVAGSYDSLAMAGSLRADYRITDTWLLGLTAEYNPFFSLEGETLRRGVFNGYLSVTKRWRMAYESVSLRTTVNAGTSVLLMDLVGAPAGSVGIFVGIVPLGLEWQVSKRINLLFDPVVLALPVPQLQGVPFAYGQYRSALGFEVLAL